MITLQLVRNNKDLMNVFKSYQKSYLSVGKKPDITKLLPEDLYFTMHLEGERITRKQEILITLYEFKLLHPIMFFVTEAIWQEMAEKVRNEKLLLISNWPH